MQLCIEAYTNKINAAIGKGVFLPVRLNGEEYRVEELIPLSQCTFSVTTWLWCSIPVSRNALWDFTSDLPKRGAQWGKAHAERINATMDHIMKTETEEVNLCRD